MFSSYEYKIGMCPDPVRNPFFGATDAMLDAEEAILALRSGFAVGTPMAKLAAYGFLQALFIQQDAALIIHSIAERGKLPDGSYKPHLDPIFGPIRILRNRVCGHPAYAQHAGGTAAIPTIRQPFYFEAAIYGLKGGSYAERFPRLHIGELIEKNAQGLLPLLEAAYAKLGDELHVKNVVWGAP